MPWPFFEATHGAEGTVEHHDAVEHDADLVVAADLALGDHTTGDGAGLGHAEGGADLGRTGLNLLLRGLEHAATGGVDVLDRLVDDGVRLDLDVLALRGVAGLGLRANAEADDVGVGGHGQRDVGLGDGADG